MALSDANTIIQLIANVAVVASVLFLAVQARLGIRMLRDAAERNHMDKHQSISRMLSENPQLAELWARGNLGGIEKLSAAERVQFLNFYMYVLRIWEELYLQHCKGVIDKAVWEANARALRDTQVMTGAQDCWSIRRHMFTATFRNFYEDETERGEARPLYTKSTAV